MVVKLTNLTKKSANINKIIETKYDYFNIPSTYFVGSRNSFLFVFVLIWHFKSIRSHFNSMSSPQ